jgi:hypothetical protein
MMEKKEGFRVVVSLANLNTFQAADAGIFSNILAFHEAIAGKARCLGRMRREPW